MPTKILLDTDIGSDIDDAVCLAYLLANPKCDLLGITTVSGESHKRAMLASVLCKIAHKNIPIYPGTENPLLGPQKQPLAPQAKALKDWAHKKTFPQGKAIEFLRKTIHQHPHEIILLSIGPLTNIALLFKTDSTIPSLLKGLVSMCGCFSNRLPNVGPLEWNALCDPHATAIVYNTPLKFHRSIGIDITFQVTMDIKQVTRKFQTKLLQPVLDLAQIWFQERDKIIFHDPLAATTIFNNQICTFQKGNVNVELVKRNSLGQTHWSPNSRKTKHEIATSVNPTRFFNHYFSVFT